MFQFFIINIIIFLVITSGCEKHRDSSFEEYKNVVLQINLDNAMQVKMSDVFTSINYLPLITPESDPIGRVWKIEFINDKIIVFDRSNFSVWIFNNSGLYVNHIEPSIGRGPGEIRHPTDMTVTNSKVYILGAYKILAYDFEGKLLEEINTDFLVNSFGVVGADEEVFVGYNDNSIGDPGVSNDHDNSSLFFFNAQGKIIESFLPVKSGMEFLGYTVPDRFPSYASVSMFFPHLLDNKIYGLTSNSIEPIYELDFGNHQLPDEIFDLRYTYTTEKYDWARFWDEEVKSADYVSNISSFEETDSLIILIATKNLTNYIITYKKNKNTFLISKDRLVNDIDYGPSPFLYLSSDDRYYSFIEANDLLRYINDVYRNENELYNSDEFRELVLLAFELESTSNPILIEYNY